MYKISNVCELKTEDVGGVIPPSSGTSSGTKKLTFSSEVRSMCSEERCGMVGFVNDSAGFNAGVMMDVKRLPSIGDPSGNLPDVSELDASVFLEDVEATSMNVPDMGHYPGMQQNVRDVGRPVRKRKTVCSQVSVEEFEGGRVYRGVGTSNPGGNVNVENFRANINRSTGTSNPVLNVVPNPGYGSTSNSPYVSWLEEHYQLLVTNNVELYNRVEKLSSKKVDVECQVNELKGKLFNIRVRRG
ncbi:hypothetical protein Tco_1359593 [Tanacetum coccineum]